MLNDKAIKSLFDLMPLKNGGDLEVKKLIHFSTVDAERAQLLKRKDIYLLVIRINHLIARLGNEQFINVQLQQGTAYFYHVRYGFKNIGIHKPHIVRRIVQRSFYCEATTKLRILEVLHTMTKVSLSAILD